MHELGHINLARKRLKLINKCATKKIKLRTKNAAKLKQTEGRERGRPDNVNINLTMQRLKKYVCKKRTKTKRNVMESKGRVGKGRGNGGGTGME